MREPASIRYKNPGAMWGNKLAVKWGAAPRAVTLNDGKGQGNNIAVFPTHVQGICAQLDLWRSSSNYRNRRFADAIAIWSGHNEVPSYIDFCKRRVPGLSENTVMNDDFWRGPMGIAFLKAQAWHEAGKPYPAPEKDWIEAQHRVFDGDNDFGELPAKPSKPLAQSKIAQGSTAVIVGEGADILNQVSDAADKMSEVKRQADSVGAFDVLGHLVTEPRFLVAVVVIVIAGLVIYWRWRDHQ